MVAIMHLGPLIKSIRLTNGIDQSTLADGIGVSQQTVSRWEKCESKPRKTDLAKIMDFFELNKSDRADWMKTAGYSTTEADFLPTHCYDKPLPFNNLKDDETFENLVVDLLSAQPGVQHPTRYGVRGENQHGIDIEARTDSGLYLVAQCKLRKNFGPTDLISAINCIESGDKNNANKKIIIISREASAAIRDETKKHKGYELWDRLDLSSKIRQLPSMKRYQIAKTYFPTRLKEYFGITEPICWESPDEFFKHRANRKNPVDHGWDLIGRSQELDTLKKLLASEARPACIVAQGGEGKTRLLREIRQKHEVWFAIKGEKITRQSILELGPEQKLLVVDDAHEREDLPILMEYIANPDHKAQLLLTTRPYAFEKIKLDSLHFGIELTEVKLQTLKLKEKALLSKKILDFYNANATHSEFIATQTQHEPTLGTVVLSYLVAKNKVTVTSAIQCKAYRDQIKCCYKDLLLSNINDHDETKPLLELIAILQPISIERLLDYKTLIRPHTKLTEMTTAEIYQLADRLTDHGAIYKRGQQYQLTSDVLGDFLISDIPLDTQEIRKALTSTDQFSTISNVLKNLGRAMDAGAFDKEVFNELFSYICDTLIDKQGHDNTWILIDAITETAFYLPEMAFSFAQRAIKNGRLLETIPRLLKNVAYYHNLLPDVCELLWKLTIIAADTKPSQNTAPSTLKALCSPTPIEKPTEFTETAVSWCINKIDTTTNISQKLKLLALLEDTVSPEGIDARFFGNELKVTRYTTHGVMRPIRQEVISKSLQLLSEQNTAVAMQATKILGTSLRYPIGIQDKEQYQNTLTKEFADTLTKIKETILANGLPYEILLELQDITFWHLTYNKDDVLMGLAQEITDLMPIEDARFLLLKNLGEHWDHLPNSSKEPALRSERQAKSGINIEADIQELAKRLLEQSPPKLVEEIEDTLSLLDRCNKAYGHSAHRLIEALVKEDIEFSKHMISLISNQPESKLTRFAHLALAEIILAGEDTYTKSLIKIADNKLLMSVSLAYSKVCDKRALNAGELDTLKEAIFQSDIDEVLLSGTYILGSLLSQQSHNAIPVLLSVDLGLSTQIADGYLALFKVRSNITVKDLNEYQLNIILGKLLQLKELDSYGIATFLSSASLHHPKLVAEFFMRRVIDLKTDSFARFKLSTFNNDLRLKYRDLENCSEYMQLVFDWLRALSNDTRASDKGAMLFVKMFGPLDDFIIRFLEEKLSSRNLIDTKITLEILSYAPPSFVTTNVNLITSLMDQVESFNDPELESSAQQLLSLPTYTAARSGKAGQPFSEDVKLKEDTEAILKHLSRLSSAYKIYQGLLQYAERQIELYSE